MEQSFIKPRFRAIFARRRLETGFSMLEAVVVVGVLLALAVGGFFAYGPIAENAKKAKVKSSASEVHTGVLVASMDGDPATNPQGVIDAWNASTAKIRVEILEPETSLGAMTTAAPTAGANGDFCVQATNVESPHITARVGACTDVEDGGGTPVVPTPTPTPAPLPDTDSDGIPDATDPDIDNNGTPNTAWESYDVVKDRQAAGEEVSYVNTDGSTVTWNYKDTDTYGHHHTPIAPNVLTSPRVDIISIQKDTTDYRALYVTIGTDGHMSTATGAVGGHFGVYMHGDVSCKNNSSGVVTERFGRGFVNLDALYIGATGDPGYNTGNAYYSCPWGETPVGFTLYPDRYSDWLKSDGSPGYSYFFTKDQIVNWTPAAG